MISNLIDQGDATKTRLDRDGQSGRPRVAVAVDHGHALRGLTGVDRDVSDDGVEGRRNTATQRDQEVYDYFLSDMAKSKQKADAVSESEWKELAESRREFEQLKEFQVYFKD